MDLANAWILYKKMGKETFKAWSHRPVSDRRPEESADSLLKLQEVMPEEEFRQMTARAFGRGAPSQRVASVGVETETEADRGMEVGTVGPSPLAAMKSVKTARVTKKTHVKRSVSHLPTHDEVNGDRGSVGDFPYIKVFPSQPQLDSLPLQKDRISYTPWSETEKRALVNWLKGRAKGEQCLAERAKRELPQLSDRSIPSVQTKIRRLRDSNPNKLMPLNPRVENQNEVFPSASVIKLSDDYTDDLGQEPGNDSAANAATEGTAVYNHQATRHQPDDDESKELCRWPKEQKKALIEFIREYAQGELDALGMTRPISSSELGRRAKIELAAMFWDRSERSIGRMATKIRMISSDAELQQWMNK